MAEPLPARFEGVRRLAGLAVVLSLFVACGNNEDPPPGGPSPPTVFAVSSVAPNTGIGGAALTINGSGFRTGATATIGGINADVWDVSSSKFFVRLPDLASGLVDIVVTNPTGESATLAGAFTAVPFAVHPTPPQKGYPSGLFFLVGSGLIQGTSVKFDGVPVAQVIITSMGVAGLLPPHDPGPVDITVTSLHGRSLTIPNGLTYVSPPVLTASPETVTAGGSVAVTWVTEVLSPIDYIGLFPVGGMEWDEIAAQLVRGNSGSMTFTAPSPPGRYEFRYLPFEGQWGAMAARSNVVTVK